LNDGDVKELDWCQLFWTAIKWKYFLERHRVSKNVPLMACYNFDTD